MDKAMDVLGTLGGLAGLFYFFLITALVFTGIGVWAERKWFQEEKMPPSPFDKVRTKTVATEIEGRLVTCHLFTLDNGINWYEYRREGKAVKVRGRNRLLWKMFDDRFLEELAAKGPKPPPGAVDESKW